jgi:cytidylate kinase
MAIVESIVVTGTPFSGKTTLAKVLAEHFGWKFFSVSDAWRLEWKKKYPKGDTGFDNYMLQTTDVEHRAMDKMVGDIVKKGHVVVDARHGFLYRDPQVLIVFTKCDIDERSKRALEKKAYPTNDFAIVKEVLEQEERDAVDRCMALYNEDYRDPKNYDMEFDTTDSAPDEAIERIMSLRV